MHKNINIFVAGNEINDTAIVTTQGALEQLDAFEFKALVAHEFGQILNGRMKISLRFLGLFFGGFWPRNCHYICLGRFFGGLWPRTVIIFV